MLLNKNQDRSTTYNATSSPVRSNLPLPVVSRVVLSSSARLLVDHFGELGRRLRASKLSNR